MYLEAFCYETLISILLVTYNLCNLLCLIVTSCWDGRRHLHYAVWWGSEVHPASEITTSRGDCFFMHFLLFFLLHLFHHFSSDNFYFYPDVFLSFWNPLPTQFYTKHHSQTIYRTHTNISTITWTSVFLFCLVAHGLSRIYVGMSDFTVNLLALEFYSLVITGLC